MDDFYGSEKSILFNTVRIAYYFLPNSTKETIFFLHPAFADHEIFEAQVSAFHDYYQIILIDFPYMVTVRQKAREPVQRTFRTS